MANRVPVNGSKVSDLRGAKRWKIAQLAGAANVSERTISSMEASQPIRRDLVAAVAKALEVSPTELIATEAAVAGGSPPAKFQAFREWQYKYLVELLHRVEREDDESEDLRIVTTAFSGSVTDLQLSALLEKNIRTKILLMNPDNQVLMMARHGKRKDESPAGAYSIVKGQITLLEFTKEALADQQDCRGTLEWRLSNAMPYAFVAHTKRWALVALFLAEHTLSLGPIIEVGSDTAVWTTLLKDWRERWTDADPKRKQDPPQLILRHTPEGFDDFFGDSASTKSSEGVVVLQCDRIESLFDRLLNDPAAKIKAVPPHRLYKARTWLNRWDTDGATAIQEEFQKHGINAPKLLLSEHHSRDEIPASAPFQIAMGLGFTDRAKVAFDICTSWMRVTREPGSGDAVSFHKGLLPVRPLSRLSAPAESEEENFFRLLPLGWDADYLERWLQGAAGTNTVQDVQDYAIILRHTQNADPRQVTFVVAGFTERGTAIGGRYLAKGWQKLWMKYVAGKVTKPSRGDFLIVIAGPSWPGTTAAWKEDPNFEAITPDRLRKNIDCEWSRRFD